MVHGMRVLFLCISICCSLASMAFMIPSCSVLVPRAVVFLDIAALPYADLQTYEIYPINFALTDLPPLCLFSFSLFTYSLVLSVQASGDQTHNILGHSHDISFLLLRTESRLHPCFESTLR